MDSSPLVSIICLCHNQKPYVRKAIESAMTQTYANIELIIIDDASTDGSQEEITAFTNENPHIPFMLLSENVGNCKAFNIAFQKSQGDFIIDLAGDDILLPKRVETGIEDFTKADSKVGVHFSDAFMIDEQGKTLHTHFDRDEDGKIKETIPSGDLYELLISRYFICPPTMMIRREVLQALNGYDEKLSYEDFDFWIRSSRSFQYAFNRAPLVKKRIVKGSLSTQQFKLRNRHQLSTYLVCEKILHLNKTKAEHQALIKRCNYEIRQCLRTGNLGLMIKYFRLKKLARKLTYLRLSSPPSIER